jgi:hypothetical protein
MTMKFSKIHVDIVDTFEKFQGERVKNFSQFVVENFDPTLNESDYQKEVDARVKVHRNLLWINARKGFFAQLLSKLNIYGVSDPRYQTMCTNGFNIQYHPDFVLGQSDPAIRFVLCHEILHCVGDHMSRRGSRDPLLWNYACDYAINPILNVEVVGGAFEWPANLDGSRMGLYEEKYEGMKAEDIYDLLVDDKQQQEKADEAFKDDPQKGMHVIDADEDLGEPNEESVVQEVGDEEGEDKPEVNPGGDPGDPINEPGEPVDEPGGYPGGEPGEPGDGPGEPGDGPGKPGDGPGGPGGKPGEEEGGKPEDGGSGQDLIGRRARITAGPNAGRIGTIRQVLPNGDIIIE